MYRYAYTLEQTTTIDNKLCFRKKVKKKSTPTQKLERDSSSIKLAIRCQTGQHQYKYFFLRGAPIQIQYYLNRFSYILCSQMCTAKQWRYSSIGCLENCRSPVQSCSLQGDRSQLHTGWTSNQDADLFAGTCMVHAPDADYLGCWTLLIVKIGINRSDRSDQAVWPVWPSGLTGLVL